MALKERRMLKEKPVLKARKPFSREVLATCQGRCVAISGRAAFQSSDISKLKEDAYKKQRSLLLRSGTIAATDE